MKIEFYHYSPASRVPHHPVRFERDIPTAPHVGDWIVQHREDGSTTFEVKNITYVFEDRESYKDKPYGGDRIIVTLLALSQERVQESHRRILQESGCS